MESKKANLELWEASEWELKLAQRTPLSPREKEISMDILHFKHVWMSHLICPNVTHDPWKRAEIAGLGNCTMEHDSFHFCTYSTV